MGRPLASSLAVVPLLLVLAGGSGCSYIFVHGPPPRTEVATPGERWSRSSTVECTTSNAVPIVDTLLGAPLIGLGALVFVGSAAAESKPSTFGSIGPTQGEAMAIGAAAVAVGSLVLASAVSGYGRTADCRQALESSPLSERPHPRHLLEVSGIGAARSRDSDD